MQLICNCCLAPRPPDGSDVAGWQFTNRRSYCPSCQTYLRGTDYTPADMGTAGLASRSPPPRPLNENYPLPIQSLDNEGDVAAQLSKLLLAAGWEPTEVAPVIELMPSTYHNEAEYEYGRDLRVARCSVPEEVVQFRSIRAQGCDGEYDTTLEAIRADGTTSYVLFGFNYGD